MNQLSGGKNSGVLLVLALVMALLFAVYYYVVLPKTNEVSAIKSSVSSVQLQGSTLQESIFSQKERDSLSFLYFRRSVF